MFGSDRDLLNRGFSSTKSTPINGTTTPMKSFKSYQSDALTFASRVPFCLMIMLLPASALLADNASHRDYRAPFAICDTEYSEALKEEANTLYLKAYDAVSEYKQTLSRSGAHRLSDRELCKTWVELKNLERIGELLVINGETAGHDFLSREGQLFGSLKNIVEQYQTDSRNSATISKLTKLSDKQRRARTTEAKVIIDLVSEGKWETAETRMYKALDQMNGQFAVLNYLVRNRIYQPFDVVFGQIRETMAAKRTALANERASARLAKEKPDFGGILSKIDSAIASIGSSGSATWNAGTVNGPELTVKIGEEWAEAQVKTFHCRNLEWFIGSNRGSSEYDSRSTSSKIEKTPTDKAFDEFSLEIIKRLSAVIEADAGRVAGGEAEKLYPLYTSSLAPLQRLTFTDLNTQLSDAFSLLAEKSESLKTSVANYATATDDLLRWRKRVAESTAKSKENMFPQISEVHFKTMKSSTDYTGIYPNSRPDIYDARLLTRAPKIVLPVIDELMGTDVTFPDVVRWDTKNATLIGRYDKRHYGSIPAVKEEIVDRYLTRLKAELMVDEKHGPLSLNAATAISSMSRSDLRNVGGSIEGLFLESLVTRFGALPDVISEIVPLGRLPGEPVKNSAVTHVLMRYTVVPQWVQFDHAFVDLTKEKQDPGASVETQEDEEKKADSGTPEDVDKASEPGAANGTS